MRFHAGNGVRRTLVPLAVVVLMALNGKCAAQGTGSIVGVVQDPAGNAVVGATITIKNVQTGVSRTMSTDANGYYSSSQLPIGQYEVDAEAQGFAPVARTG